MMVYLLRLTVVVVKARSLRPENDENESRHDAAALDVQNVFVKVKVSKSIFMMLFSMQSTSAQEKNFERLDKSFIITF